MKINLLKPCLLAVLGTAVTLPSMFGNILTPGNTVTPDVFTSVAGLTLLASTGPVTVNPVPGTSFNATYAESVYTDANNVFCANCLDFFIVASNAGPGIAERISTSSFGSFLTDVGYNTGTGVSGVVPSSVDRSANGAVIGFNFIPPGTDIAPGQNTVVLQIQTNATSYTSGFVSVQDGTSGFGAGYAPSAVPEPVSMALLGTGLLALGFSKKLRGNRQQNS